MSDINDSKIMLRFRYGIHTIFLFTDVLATHDAVASQLLTVLRERYPTGLLSSPDPNSPRVPIPPYSNPDTDDQEDQVEFGVPIDPAAPLRNWRWTRIPARGENVLLSKAALKDGDSVAFRFSGRGHALEIADEEGWCVKFPELEEELDEEL